MKMLEVTGNNSHQKLYLRGELEHPEPAEVTLFFPGGHIGVARCSDGKYWAHIQINDADFLANSIDCDFVEGRYSEARIDCRNRPISEMDLGDLKRDDVNHFAIKVQPQKGGEKEGE